VIVRLVSLQVRLTFWDAVDFAHYGPDSVMRVELASVAWSSNARTAPGGADRRVSR
jgi:hypothetical protein